MQKKLKVAVYFFLLIVANITTGQTTSPAPYCCGLYSTGNCAQPGPSNAPGNGINDFINNFSTTGANTNISNLNSGCNGNVNNCTKYCAHYLAVTPGQTIVCTMSSGNTFAQGFAMWADWDQDNVYNPVTEYLGGSPNAPPATTPFSMSFVIPLTQPNGIYSLRLRCSFAVGGANITPCGAATFGETEDYTIFVGPVPPNSAAPSGTAVVNTPVCIGQPLNFSLTTGYTAPLSYTWTGPNNYSSTVQNPTLLNTGVNASGIYTVLVTNSICPITRTVSALVVPYPTYTPVANPSVICQGGMFVANVLSAMNPNFNQYTALWTSTASGLIFNPIPTLGNPPVFSTNVMPSLLPVNISQATNVYSVTISPTVNPACAVTQTVAVTINNPVTPTLALPGPLCDSFSPVQLIATPGGGTWSANPAVFPNGIFDPTLAVIGTNTVMYTVAIGTCMVSNSGTLSVTKFISSALSSSVAMRCVQDPAFNLMNVVQNTVTGYWSTPNNQGQLANNFFNAANLATGNYTVTYHTNSTPIPNICPDSTRLVIPVFKPPVPIIPPIPKVCNTAPVTTLVASPPNGVWSGATGVSPSGVKTPSSNLVGTNTVSYTAGQGTCVATSSTTFHVSKFNTAALTGIIPDLCSNSNPVNLMSIVQNTNGVWSDAKPSQFPSSSLVNNTFNPAGLGGPPTYTYALKYTTFSLPDSLLCSDSRSIIVNILNPQVPTIFQTAPLCSKGNPIQLGVSPNIGSWIPTPYLTSKGQFDPALAAIGNNPVQYVIGTSTCNIQSSAMVSVEAFVSAAITGEIADQCNTNPPISLSTFPQNSSGYWSGPGVGGSMFNPATTGSGNFVLNYHTASLPSGLCPDQATVAVQVFSLAPPIITSMGPFCNKSEPKQLIVSPVGGLFSGSIPGAVTSDGIFNPASSIIGDNYINYTISVGPCLANAQTKIEVEEFISAALGTNPKVLYCKNDLPFNLNSLVQNPGGNWGPVSSTALNQSMFDPLKANKINELTYYTSSPRGYCQDSQTLTIEVKEVPSVTGRRTSEKACAPLTVEFNVTDKNNGIATWNITNGVKLDGLVSRYTFDQPGTYSVLLSYTDEELGGGCFAQFTFASPIVVFESPKVDFSVSPNEIMISDPEVTITNLSSVINSNKYNWTIEGVDNVPEGTIHPKVKFPHAGNFRVTLSAESLEGCKNEISKQIEVKNDFYVHIPNSFTPNFDGLNDVFLPVFSPFGLDSRTFEMEIYDRWGHQVFRSKDITKGWNGTIKGDEVAKEDTYVYKIKYKDLDGRLYNKTGHLSLLKN